MDAATLVLMTIGAVAGWWLGWRIYGWVRAYDFAQVEERERLNEKRQRAYEARVERVQRHYDERAQSREQQAIHEQAMGQMAYNPTSVKRYEVEQKIGQPGRVLHVRGLSPMSGLQETAATYPVVARPQLTPEPKSCPSCGGPRATSPCEWCGGAK